jgi:flavin-dependent dehydrogenase
VRRAEFDDFLLRRSGARLRLGMPVTDIRFDDDRWILDDRIVARFLVGAGGHFCPVARRLGARSIAGAQVVRAQEIEFEATPAELAAGTVAASVPELFFCPDLAGYGWCFRKGNFLNIGLGRADAAHVSQHVAAFVAFLRERGRIHCQTGDRFHGHAYQLYERTQPALCDDGVLLVGDAAGLAYPQSGEGIRPAVESGLLAAETILDAGGDFRRQRLERYAQRLVARLGTPRAGGAGDWLPASWLRAIAARLLASKQFSRRVVLERWFLHAHDPALPAAGANAPAQGCAAS